MQNDGYGAIRVSYSILNSWAHGDIDRATAPYRGERPGTTEAMRYGKEMHRRWERETARTNCLPKVFGGKSLSSPALELSTKRAARINEWCALVGVLDLKDGDLGIDYKTGRSTASEYANSKQHECYQMLYPGLTRFEYYCFNQHLHHSDSDRVTVSIVYLSRRTLADGIEWALTNAAELREYLINNGLGHRLDQGKGLEA